MELEITVLSEMSKIQKDKYHMLFLIHRAQKKFIKMYIKMYVPIYVCMS